MKYRIIKTGPQVWVIIEPTRLLTLYDDNNKLIHFPTKVDALNYCKENGYEVSEEYQ